MDQLNSAEPQAYFLGLDLSKLWKQWNADWPAEVLDSCLQHIHGLLQWRKIWLLSYRSKRKDLLEGRVVTRRYRRSLVEADFKSSVVASFVHFVTPGGRRYQKFGGCLLRARGFQV
ncbi:hypothetical protein R1flu_001401 [Riccia fluitans]|uniref:Uncharacterized protein n=1 Tax=Riccia fluitans TaxID=41844 RepID=A0ABD1Y3I8_9MARC